MSWERSCLLTKFMSIRSYEIHYLCKCLRSIELHLEIHFALDKPYFWFILAQKLEHLP